MSGELHRFAAARLDSWRTQDAVSDVFTIVWRRWDDAPTDGEGLRRWIYGIMKNVIKDHQRSMRRQARLEDRLRAFASGDNTNRTPPLESTTTSDAWVEETLRHLSPIDAEALRLITLEGYEVNETAEVVGINPTALSMRLSRARRRLQRIILEEGSET